MCRPREENVNSRSRRRDPDSPVKMGGEVRLETVPGLNETPWTGTVERPKLSHLRRQLARGYGEVRGAVCAAGEGMVTVAMVTVANAKSGTAMQQVLDNLRELPPSSGAKDIDLIFLRGIMESPIVRSLAKAHDRLEDVKLEAVRANNLALVTDILCDMSSLASRDDSAAELSRILTEPHFKSLLEAHDMVASKCYGGVSPDLTNQQPPLLPAPPDTVRVISIHKKPGEPLGVTFRVESGDLVVARILHGGMIDRQGMLHAGDVIREVNGHQVGEGPQELQRILKEASGDITLKILPSYRDTPTPAQLFLKPHFSYSPETDNLIPCKEAGLAFTRGDVLHVVNRHDPNCWHRKSELHKKQVELGLPEHSLITDCATRWGSKLAMVERILEQAQAIRHVLSDDRRSNLSLTWQDTDVLQAVQKALKPVSDFTDILSGENYVTSSSVLPMPHAPAPLSCPCPMLQLLCPAHAPAPLSCPCPMLTLLCPAHAHAPLSCQCPMLQLLCPAHAPCSRSSVLPMLQLLCPAHAPCSRSSVLPMPHAPAPLSCPCSRSSALPMLQLLCPAHAPAPLSCPCPMLTLLCPCPMLQLLCPAHAPCSSSSVLPMLQLLCPAHAPCSRSSVLPMLHAPAPLSCPCSRSSVLPMPHAPAPLSCPCSSSSVLPMPHAPAPLPCPCPMLTLLCPAHAPCSSSSVLPMLTLLCPAHAPAPLSCPCPMLQLLCPAHAPAPLSCPCPMLQLLCPAHAPCSRSSVLPMPHAPAPLSCPCSMLQLLCPAHAPCSRSSVLPMLQLCKDDVLAVSDEDVQLTKLIKTGILDKLEAKYQSDSVRKLMRKCTFLDPRYCGGYETDATALAETKTELEAEMVILEGQAAAVGPRPTRVEEGEGQPEPPKSSSAPRAKLSTHNVAYSSRKK
ncbi:hypothetical protein ACEWY4_019348 [Coilia grayii]|uniref:Uncharacterized protein n=1 Tax=Coilia grayii TaxID=363190 RepID=A0ABD1JB83_9TELE